MSLTEKATIARTTTNGHHQQHHRKMVISEEESPQQFALRIKNMVTNGLQALAISVAARHGVFEVMKSPKTSYEIAQEAGLKERYVRELLHSFVVSRIVEMNPDKNTYHIAPQHLPFLTGKHSLAGMTCLVPMLCEGYSQVNECFKIDGPSGVSYDQYPGFQEFMDHMSNMMHNQTLLSDFVPSVDGLEKRLESGISVLDIGCGRARAPLILAQRFPHSNFYGIDISVDAVATAQKEASRKGLKNTTFLVKDAASLPSEWSEKFDFVTAFDCIHDQAEPEAVLRESKRVLKSDGVFSMLELAVSSHPWKNIGNPRALDGYVISMFHCMPVSLYMEGKGLGTMWGKENILETLSQIGFRDVKVHKCKDMFNFHYVCRKEINEI
ncbi:S-adenosylmethionine-dependent methyltransferase Rv2258c-like [Ptychodera flava]|uniref:S-adenosylmethionine-dependent methyltransferase Rv2258c-like n=1 Tax=Ptychodera flava TaxID=63121 RepID=UPI00396A304E